MMCFCLFLTSSIIIIFTSNIIISAFFLTNIHYPENLPLIYCSCICNMAEQIQKSVFISYLMWYLPLCLCMYFSSSWNVSNKKKEMNCCWPNCVYLIKALHTEKENSNARYILYVDVVNQKVAVYNMSKILSGGKIAYGEML